MTIILIVELILLASIVFLAFWFNTKKCKDMMEWRARKSEIAHLL